MKTLKPVMNLIILFFLSAGTYFLLSGKVSDGYTPRGGKYSSGFQRSVITWYALYFFALVFIFIRIMIWRGDREERKKAISTKKSI